MTKSLQRIDAAAFLNSHDNYVILTHIRPDGDTLGSASALCLGLRSLGKTAHVLVNPGVSQRYGWMVEGLTVEEAGKDDTVVSTDVASPGMLPENAKPYLGRVALRIDHHGSATSFSDLELVDPDSASCAEVVYDVLELMEAPRQAEVLDRIYVGLSGGGVRCAGKYELAQKPPGLRPDLCGPFHGYRLLPLRQHHGPHLPGGRGLCRGRREGIRAQPGAF